MNKEEEKIARRMEEIDEFTRFYVFVGSQDRHIVRLFHWVKILENLRAEVSETDVDKELEKDLIRLIARLINEIGTRIWMIAQIRISAI